VDTTLDEVETSLQEAFGRFFAKESSSHVVRSAEPLGFDKSLWDKVLALGALRLAVPENVGGDGAGLGHLGLVVEQMGRNLAPVPLIDSAVAARVLARSANPEARSHLDSMLGGDRIIVLSFRPLDAGSAHLVPNGAIADSIVAMEDDRLLLVPVEGPSPRSARPNLGSMPIADCQAGRPILELASGPKAIVQFSWARTEWKALTAAALVGLADRALEIALDYVKVRKAFGTLIGAFQTVSHRLADSVVDLDGARLLSYEAAWSIDEGREDAPALASMSYLFASRVARSCSGLSLHFHGGVGFTLEHDIQLYYRRSVAWPLAFSDTESEWQHLADLLYGKAERRRR
jgi:alkylation response protein AidB-like acyl-CoA dehydrogenase